MEEDDEVRQELSANVGFDCCFACELRIDNDAPFHPVLWSAKCCGTCFLLLDRIENKARSLVEKSYYGEIAEMDICSGCGGQAPITDELGTVLCCDGTECARTFCPRCVGICFAGKSAAALNYANSLMDSEAEWFCMICGSNAGSTENFEKSDSNQYDYSTLLKKHRSNHEDESYSEGDSISLYSMLDRDKHRNEIKVFCCYGQ